MTSSPTVPQQWEGGGPQGSDVRDLVLDPATPGRVYAATAGNGVFRSTDSAATWERANAGLPLAIEDLTIGSDGVLYAVQAFPAVVYRSDDAGQTWIPGASGLEGAEAKVVATDPINSAVAYLASRLQATVFKSEDSGETWEPSDEGLPLSTPRFLHHDPQQSGRLYLGVGFGSIYRTEDSGATWTPLSGWPALRLMAIHPQDPQTIYGVVGNAVLWKTTDGGQTWIELPGGLPDALSIDAIALDPVEPALLFIAGRDDAGLEDLYPAFSSSDGGASWILLSGALNRTPATTLAATSVATGFVAAGTHSGVRRSMDGGDTWADATVGLTGLTEQLLVADPVRPDRAFLGALWVGPWRSIDGGANWSLTIGERPYQGLFGNGLAISPLNPDRVYRSGCGEISRSDDGGVTWTEIEPLPFCMSAIAAGGQDAEEVWGGVEAIFSEGVPVIWRSVDGGDNWEPSFLASTSPCCVPSWFRFIVVDPTDGLRVLAAYYTLGGTAPARVVRTLDGGATWEEPLVVDFVREVLFLEVDPRTPSVWYLGLRPVSGTDQLLRSSDTGATWQPVIHGLPCLSALAVDPLDSSLYGGCDRVYRSHDGGTSWQPFPSLGLPPDLGSVGALEIPPTPLRRIWSFTNVGVYTFDLTIFADGFESGDTSAWAVTLPGDV